MPWPAISLVTPSFNQARYLEETLRSVLDQGYPNLQYGVVDGGSTDGSDRIIQRYRDRLDYAIIEPDGGQSEAINKGLARSRGQVIGWLCSDDLLAPGALQAVGRWFADHPDCQWLSGACQMIDPEGRPLELRRPKGCFTLTGVLLRPVDGLELPQPSTFWRRGLLDRVGLLDTDLHYAMDFDLWCRFVMAGAAPAFLDQTLAGYRLHPASKTCAQAVGFLSDHLAIESRCAAALPWRARWRMRRRLGYRRRELALRTCGGRVAPLLWRRPWWLLSQQVRQALRQAA